MTRLLQFLLIITLSGAQLVTKAAEAEGNVPLSRSVDRIVSVTPFSLENSYTSYWQKERPKIREGSLVVLQMKQYGFLKPTEAMAPILYLGDHTAERVNFGHDSGYLIVISPEKIGSSDVMAWFGRPSLPENIDKKAIVEAKALAVKSGIKGLNVEVTHAKLELKNKKQLQKHAAEMALKLSPQEKNFLAPFVK